MYKTIYPRFRYVLSLGRKIYTLWMKITTILCKRPISSSVIPDSYRVCNTSTKDSDINLICLKGAIPSDINGSLFINQCLGTPEAYMVGDTNIIRIDFASGKEPQLINRRMWTPAAMARIQLEETRHKFDFFGLMYLSPGLGMFSYTEGLFLLPDGRIAVTSDVDRPWVIERDTLKVVTPVGKRSEWFSMLPGQAGEILGDLFAGYNNSHVVYTDFEKNETFLVCYQIEHEEGIHPVKLIRWDGFNDFDDWLVVDENYEDIKIEQSIHELIFTRDYIILADTAFVAGTNMFTPWVSSPLPNQKTVIYIVERKDLKPGADKITAKRIEVDEPCIHLISEYENPNNNISLYMLHTPATNTAEILRFNDRDLRGNLFPEYLVGHGTLPVLDLSSVGKHVINATDGSVVQSSYIREIPYCWGPYLYTFKDRQIKPYQGQDLYVMFKGFHKDLLPQRIYNAYKNIKNRRVPLEEMLGENGLLHNSSICRVTTDEFSIADAYILPDRVYLYTISHLNSDDLSKPGYIIAGIVTDEKANTSSNGHEYWIFEANDLTKGPVCILGHPSLNNTTLFHTIYLPESVSSKFNQIEATYYVPLREDYPKEELKKWDATVLQSFEEIIWPYFDLSK